MNLTDSQLILAPMEGVLDHLMRELLTSLNPFDLCITEFIRIVDSLLPERVFHRLSPELCQGGATQSGVPIRIQLLGQDSNWLAENAVRAIELGSNGIDLNFGCPAKTVNKNKGGAVLLKSPETIYQIVSNVKNSLERSQCVSVKIRLGFEDSSLFNEIVDAVVQANANLLTIHARTKSHGYRPPAYWDLIGKLPHHNKIDIVANGEIWSLTDAKNCIMQAKTPHLMLGRGVLALPNLAAVIKDNATPMSWPKLCVVFKRYCELEQQGEKSFYFSSRLKQWLRYLKIQYPQAEQLFNAIKTLKNKDDIMREINKIS
ncbi:MAG: tRNA-dihydrouridine synthase [Alteromonadaceae bacterium]|nr:tRNA-dihydrouridine synthase [Alteromonadaceae bacterium]